MAGVLQEYEKRLSGSLLRTTLCFLVKENKVLLAMKKRGFGKGRWNGVGGKVKDEESVEGAAARETREEIGVSIESMKKVATINFYVQDVGEERDWNQKMVVFLANKWKGTPKKSDEMAPRWFEFDKIPYKKMWVDDIYWLPKVLKGKHVTAAFLFDSTMNGLKDFKISD